MKNPKFFSQLDGSTRNIPNALGVIDSTVSDKGHILYTKLWKNWLAQTDPYLYFSFRCSQDANYKDFWNPQMTEKQLQSYGVRFLKAEFDRYFKNTWEAGSTRLFTDAMCYATNYVGVTVENPTLFNGSITNFIGTNIKAPARTGGAITNFYGLKIEDNVSATNKWSVYSEDTSVKSKMLGQLESGDISVRNTGTSGSLNLNSSSTASGGNYIHAKKSNGSNQWVLGSNNANDDRLTLKQYNAANIIANLQTLTADMAANISAVLRKEDLHIYMSPKTYALYISAVSTLGYVNAYNMNGDYEPVFEGYKIAVCPGMADNELVAAQKSNLFFGTDLLSDATRITLMDMAP